MYTDGWIGSTVMMC